MTPSGQLFRVRTFTPRQSSGPFIEGNDDLPAAVGEPGSTHPVSTSGFGFPAIRIPGDSAVSTGFGRLVLAGPASARLKRES